MDTYIVLGTGYGDEGKGLVTDSLCLEPSKSLVIRFNGGQQAGHTVHDKKYGSHVFSSYGAGTFRKAHTFTSRYCTVDLEASINERNVLRDKGLDPILYVDRACPITTMFDVAWNKAMERTRRHGSVGMGFGSTLQREQDFYKLQVFDLSNKKVLESKLRLIVRYYNDKAYEKRHVLGTLYFSELENSSEWIEHFLDVTVPDYLSGIETPRSLQSIITQSYDRIIFEGAQGIMLDMDHGFFPHVTRSNTTSKNAINIIKELGLREVSTAYVTRAYKTRHGNGPMADEREILLKNNEEETNVQDDYQGNFRKGLLDIDELKYAIDCDKIYNYTWSSSIVVTCMDQIVGKNVFIDNGEEKEGDGGDE